MNDLVTRILHVEDNSGDARLVREMLAEGSRGRFELVNVARLGQAVEALGAREFDLVLLDLSLPDAQGLDTIRQIREVSSHLPIVIMSGENDQALSIEAVKEGAQDYLGKNRLDSYWLTRSILYAIERHRLLEELHSMALVDDLTGLFNRRGFFVLAEQQLKLIRRTQGKLIVMYADLDGLKRINDTFGHLEGDRALTQLARLFRKTFRDSDIIARLGGDEFALFAADSVCGEIEALPSRLQKNVQDYNARQEAPYTLSLSIGTVCLDSIDNALLEDLLNRADQAMYVVKQSKYHDRDSG